MPRGVRPARPPAARVRYRRSASLPGDVSCWSCSSLALRIRAHPAHRAAFRPSHATSTIGRWRQRTVSWRGCLLYLAFCLSTARLVLGAPDRDDAAHRPAGHVEGPHTRLGSRRVHVLRADPRDKPLAVHPYGRVAAGQEGQAAEHLLLADPGDLLKAGADPVRQQFVNRQALDRRERPPSRWSGAGRGRLGRPAEPLRNGNSVLAAMGARVGW